MANRPPTAREMIEKARMPVYDVLVGENGSIAVIVTGVKKPFTFYVSQGVLKDAAPFGKVTKQVCMNVARDLGQQECMRRGVLY